MFNEVKSEFVQLGDGTDPQTIPEHYGKYYDRAGGMFRLFGHFKGLDEMHPNFWPLICLLADQQKRIDELQAQVDLSKTDDLKAALAPLQPARKVDMRTREGRALKMAQQAGA